MFAGISSLFFPPTKIFALLEGLVTIAVSLDSAADQDGSEPTRHRLIILADMGNEPDEEPQIAHCSSY
jgi:hypothetical protein